MMMAGELLTEFMETLLVPPERYPVLNSGDREMLDPRVWHLIHERDGGICWMCERPVAKGSGEIDHLVPWSSFADEAEANRTSNLRLACVDCNQRKSNFTVPVLPRTVGITLKCWDCHERRALGRPDPECLIDEYAAWLEFADPAPDGMEFAYCGSCSLTSLTPREWIL